MRKKSIIHSIFLFLRAASLFSILCLPRSTAAQGCASCYTTTAAGGAQTVHALRTGILLLFVPPMVFFGGILIVTTRWRQPEQEPESKDRS